MGYTNHDKTLVTVSRREKQIVNKKRRLAERRALHGQHPKSAVRATRRGWWYA